MTSIQNLVSSSVFPRVNRGGDMKVHKSKRALRPTMGFSYTECNQFREHKDASTDWEKVTCKLCLKKRPKGGRG